MTFEQVLEAARAHPDNVCIPEGWGQGRAIFGGLMAAMVFEAMRARLGHDRPVRALAITFVAPASSNTPICLEVELLRHGSGVSTLLGRAVQQGQVVTLVQGSFGAARRSVVSVIAPPAPQMPALEESAAAVPHLPGVTPEFMKNLELRWAIGGLPFSGNDSRTMGGWVRLRDLQDGKMNEAHLLALVDAWPPSVLPMLRQPAAGSTLTWTIEFVQPLRALNAGDWCQYRVETEYAHEGYGHAAAALWSADGALLALSRQTVTVFA